MSRPVVREALLRLRADGLITAHQGLGTFVSHQPAPRLTAFSDVGNVGAYPVSYTHLDVYKRQMMHIVRTTVGRASSA